MPRYVTGETGPSNVTIRDTTYNFRSGAKYTITNNGLVSIEFNPKDYATGMLYRINPGVLTINIHGGDTTIKMAEDEFEEIFNSMFGEDVYANEKSRLETEIARNALFIPSSRGGGGGAKRKTRRRTTMKRKTRRRTTMKRKTRRSRVVKRKGRRYNH